MFITNKEKAELQGKLDQALDQIKTLIKHMADLQVEVQQADVSQVPELVVSNKSLSRSYWAHIEKFKSLERSVSSVKSAHNSLQKKDEVIIGMVNALNERVDFLETTKKNPLGRPKKKITIPAEKVKELKESGVWEDPIGRIRAIDEFVKQDKEAKALEKKERQRANSRKHYLKKKAEAAALKEAT